MDSSAAPARDRIVETIKRALEDHATPAADPACTFCAGAIAALAELVEQRDKARHLAKNLFQTISDDGDMSAVWRTRDS